MFSDYELAEFSIKVKQLRTDLGFSREVVSRLTGINVDTIRKIEKGVNIPRFETLEILSYLYKTDLIMLLNNYKSNTTVTFYFESIYNFIIRNDIPALLKLHADFNVWLESSNKSLLVNQTELIQLEKFFNALYLRFSDNNYSIEHIIAELITSMKISIPQFNLTNWKFIKYNILELRILYCIASLLLQNKNYELSKNILISLLDKVDITSLSKLNATFSLVKLYTLISYNHHMLDEHHDALKIAELGILLCQKNNIMENLPLLLARKGVAMFNLRMDNCELYMNQAVTLLEIQGNFELANQYKLANLKYGI